MTEVFATGFEKTALIGSLAARLGKKGIQTVVKGAKNVGSKAVKSPGGSTMGAVGLGFAGMEASNVGNKVNTFMNKAPSSMKAPSFYSVARS